MKSFFYVLFFLFFLWNPIFLFAQKEKYTKNIGVYFEVRTDTNNLKRYTEDNEIYKANYTFYYSLEYFDKNGIQKYYTRPDEHKWIFMPVYNDSVVVEYRMNVRPGLEGFFLRLKDYSQTIVQYTFWQANGMEQRKSEKTGLVENKKNIWLHPPRTDLTEILQLNPFPCIRFPLKVGKTWKGYLEIGDFWGDERWKVWVGPITNKYKYKITEICMIETELGELHCYKVKAVAESRIGKTYLTSYFNLDYGFVRYEYINIDGSQIIINLKQVDGK